MAFAVVHENTTKHLLMLVEFAVMIIMVVIIVIKYTVLHVMVICI